MTYPLPDNTTFNTGWALFEYVNTVSPIFMPYLLFILLIGFITLQVSVGQRPAAAFLSSSFLMSIISMIFYSGGVVAGYVPLVAVIMTALAFGLISWTKEQ